MHDPDRAPDGAVAPPSADGSADRSADGSAADWQPIDGHPVGRVVAAFAARSFVGGGWPPPADAAERLQVRYAVRPGVPGGTADAPAAVRVTATFGPRAEGPPGHAHGGSMAAVLDEALGVAAWLAHRPAVAARLEVDFRAPLPLGRTAVVEPEVGPPEGSDGSRVAVRGRLVGTDGTVHAEASGVFVLLGARHRGRFSGGGA